MEGLIFVMVVNKFFSWLLTDETEIDTTTQQYMNMKYGL